MRPAGLGPLHEPVAVREGSVPHVQRHAVAIEQLVQLEPHVLAQPPRAGGEAVDHRQRIRVAGERGVVAQRAQRTERLLRFDPRRQVDAEFAVAQLATVCDDAAFPGYPYPLTVADRLAACPPWLRDEAWMTISEKLRLAGVPGDVLHRAFADRHRLMERAS